MIHFSARTLQELDVSIDSQFVSEYLIDSNGQDIVFSALTNLHIDGMRDLSSIQQTTAVQKGTVQFPALQSLHISGEYPFSDDVLFRGNEQTLTDLHLSASKTLMDVCKNYKVFDNVTKRNLYRIDI
ncbi:hypothetical protein GGI02_004763, partial [Coemansia sp. RSA 2322]